MLLHAGCAVVRAAGGDEAFLCPSCHARGNEVINSEMDSSGDNVSDDDEDLTSPAWKRDALSNIRIGIELCKDNPEASSKQTWTDVMVPNGRGRCFPMMQFIDDFGDIAGLLNGLKPGIEDALAESDAGLDPIILEVAVARLQDLYGSSKSMFSDSDGGNECEEHGSSSSTKQRKAE